jgi:hypothetical protein
VLLYGEVVKLCSNICVKQGQIQVLWGLKLVQFLGPSLRKKKIQNYEYKFRENEYLFRKRKEITASYKLKTLTNITNITKSRKIT